jgi:hypothetical protein
MGDDRLAPFHARPSFGLFAMFTATFALSKPRSQNAIETGFFSAPESWFALNVE